MKNRITNCTDFDKYSRYLVCTPLSELSLEPDGDETAELDTSGIVRLYLDSRDFYEGDGEDSDDCEELVYGGATDLEELVWEPTEMTWHANWSGPYC